MFCSIQHSAQ